MSRISEFAVTKRSVILLLAGAVFIAGILAWGGLKQELLPDIEFPVITVIAPLPGAGAADVAEQVTKPVERAISGVPRLENLQSTSANSLALVVAQFSFGTDVKEVRATIEQNLQNAGLPQSVKPQVSALNINAAPVIIASVASTSDTGLDDAARIAQDEIAPALLGIDGVAGVDVAGGEEQRVTITLDQAKLAANNVTVAQVTGVLAANNLTFPSGQITTETTQIPVSTIGHIESVDQVKNMVDRFDVADRRDRDLRSEEHTSELQSRRDLVCRLLLEKKKKKRKNIKEKAKVKESRKINKNYK